MYRLPKTVRALLWLALLLTLQACATSTSLQVAREQFRHGSTADALQTLSEASVSRRDQLLLYLDRGMVAQAAGQYTDSVVAFERAITLIDELDYVSLRDQTSALITNDWARRYSGEYSERLWIHTFQMMNFLLLGLPEGAAVEARRAAALFEEQGDLLNQDQFTRSLMGLSFESAGQSDSAQVEYRRLAEDFDDPVPSITGTRQSELIVFVASGFISPKLPGDLFVDYDVRISWPYYAEYAAVRPNITVLSQEQEPLKTLRADTTLVSISQKALEKRGKTIAARQALRIAAKHNIANALEKEDAVAGGIARLLLAVIEQADTRSWETLPANMLLLRIPLPAGEQTITLRLNDYTLEAGSIDYQRTLDVSLKPGERQFRLIRTGVNIN